MIHIRGFWAATSARWNSGENGLIRSRSRTCLALLPIVLLATPNASLSSPAVTYGSLAGSNTKFAWPSAYTTPAAHVARRPVVSGDGRLRASFARTATPRAFSPKLPVTQRVAIYLLPAADRQPEGAWASPPASGGSMVRANVLASAARYCPA
jgi:hypothetical protein